MKIWYFSPISKINDHFNAINKWLFEIKDINLIIFDKLIRDESE